MASSLELITKRSPSLYGEDDLFSEKIETVAENNSAHIARERVHEMLRSNTRDPDQLTEGEVILM